MIWRWNLWQKGCWSSPKHFGFYRCSKPHKIIGDVVELQPQLNSPKATINIAAWPCGRESECFSMCVFNCVLCYREENAALENAEPVQLFWKADKKSIHQIDDGNSTKSFVFGVFCRIKRCGPLCFFVYSFWDVWHISSVHSLSCSFVHRPRFHRRRNDQSAVPGHCEASHCFLCGGIQWYVMLRDAVEYNVLLY